MEQDQDLPKFVVLEKSLIGNKLHEPGDIVQLPAGTLPADNLQPLDEAGHALAAEYTKSNAKRIDKMTADADKVKADSDDMIERLMAKQAKQAQEANADLAAKLTAGIAQGMAEAIKQLLAAGAFGQAPAAQAPVQAPAPTGKGSKLKAGPADADSSDLA